MPSALLDTGLGLLKLLEDPVEILGRRCRGRCRPRRPLTSPLARVARTSTAPPAGANFTAFESRLKMTCLMRRSSPATTSTSRFACERHLNTVLSSLAPAPSTTPRSSASWSENGATSSSTCPASTLERSRTSLMSERRWLAEERMSSRYSCLLRVHLAGHPLAQHLREADDRVQRRPQLVRHVGQESDLCLLAVSSSL